MDILQVFQAFTTQDQAIEYLEKVRWRGVPACPYCASVAVGRHASGDRAQQRWQCRSCTRAFAVTIGTIFHGTHIPLRSWFLLLALMLNAKKSASACQIARDLGIRRATVWSMMHQVRIAMARDPKQSVLLHGIVEADETYVGGKPRSNNDKTTRSRANRRQTTKVPVIGVVERGGRVVARAAEPGEVCGRGLAKFIETFVDTDASLLVTDESQNYNSIGRSMKHARINHMLRYADGLTHTNTIEGFWAIVKRAWYGQHHHYSRKYMSLYIAEACYKYNRRAEESMFDEAMALMASAA